MQKYIYIQFLSQIGYEWSDSVIEEIFSYEPNFVRGLHAL